MNDKLLLQSFNYTVCRMWLMQPDGVMWGGLLKESQGPRCPLNNYISLQVGPNISVY